MFQWLYYFTLVVECRFLCNPNIFLFACLICCTVKSTASGRPAAAAAARTYEPSGRHQRRASAARAVTRTRRASDESVQLALERVALVVLVVDLDAAPADAVAVVRATLVSDCDVVATSSKCGKRGAKADETRP